MSKKLNSCPKCNSKSKLYHFDNFSVDGHRNIYFIQCKKCAYTTPVCESRNEAIRAWKKLRREFK